MATVCPKYIQLAQKILSEMADNGVDLDPRSDLGEIWEILTTSRRVLEPTDPALARKIMAPIVTLECGVKFFCLPIGVHDALWEILESDRYSEWDRLLGQAYAAAHAHNQQFWQSPPAPASFRRIVRKWARGIDATAVEIAAALRELSFREYESLQPVPGGASSVGWLQLLETLIREYGHDSDYWTWTATTDEINGLMSARAERQEAEEQEMMKSAKPGQAPRLSPNQYHVRAMDTLLKVRDRIIAEKKETDDEQP